MWVWNKFLVGLSRHQHCKALHSLSAADVAGAFSGKGKATWWKASNTTSRDILQALTELETSANLSTVMMDELEKLVCQVYVLNMKLTDIEDVRWWLFTNKQHQGESLHPQKNLYIQLFLGLTCKQCNGIRTLINITACITFSSRSRMEAEQWKVCTYFMYTALLPVYYSRIV